MPVISLQLVVSDDERPLEARAVQGLADALGAVFGRGPGTTWLRVDYLPLDQYAENGVPAGEVRPTFVEVLRRDLLPHDELAREAQQVAAIVAAAVDRPQQNVHVLYPPPGAGRIAFGGRLTRPS